MGAKSAAIGIFRRTARGRKIFRQARSDAQSDRSDAGCGRNLLRLYAARLQRKIRDLREGKASGDNAENGERARQNRKNSSRRIVTELARFRSARAARRTQN